MSKSQSNLIKLVGKSVHVSNINLDEIIHPKRAEDLMFKSSLYEAINILEDNKVLEKTDLDDRFALANLYHWLHKRKSISRHIAKTIFEQVLKPFTEPQNLDHENINKLINFFSPTLEDESISVNIFPELKDHLNVYDLVEVIRGIDSLFNLIIQRHFDEKSKYSLIKLSSFIDVFKDKIQAEIKSKSEMSFMFDSGSDSGVKLAISEVYRAYLNSIFPVFFKDINLPTSSINSFNLRLIVESNMTYAPEIIEMTYRSVNENDDIKKVVDKLRLKIEKGNEDEVDEAADKLKKLMISIIDKIELNLHIKQYQIRHHLEDDQHLVNSINELLKKFNKEAHFTIYSLNKLIEFRSTQLFNNDEWMVYIREMSETTALLKTEEINVPDDEMRFFIDRVLKNTNDIISYKDLFSSFRAMLKDKERNHILHDLLQECAINARHASALLSFFYSAKFEITYGNKISLVNIEEVANRLGSTFSVTRRFKMAKFVEDTLNTGKVKGQPIELLQNSGYFALVVTNIMNQKELEYAFDQYLNMKVFFKPFDDAKPRSEYIRALVGEVDAIIKTKITEKFKDCIDSIENNREKHEVTIYGQTKVITLLCRELDSRRRDKTVKEFDRDEMMEFIDNYVFDARGQYEAEKETRKINIADLYMQIQHYSMRVSVVLGEERQKYNKNVETIRTSENFTDVERMPIILGGISMAHREETLNFEKKGLFNLIDEINSTPELFQQLVNDSINKKHGNIEVKDEMGKTRKIFDDFFKETNAIIQNFTSEKLANVLINVILIDLLREVADALVSSRNMAKNSKDLKTALDDIFARSSDLLEYAEKEYNRIMGITA